MNQDVFEYFKKLTLTNKLVWEQSRYNAFLQSCTTQELLESQIPFFYAVQEFPKMLLNLASVIPTTEQRVLLMKNIVEEHGNFNEKSFHTTTFIQHLNALGLGNKPLTKSPFVSAWINWFYITPMQPYQKASALAAVEYIYAVVCETIVNVLQKHSIASPHYKKHSVLDWEHAQELLEVALLCDSCVDEDIFKQSQTVFLDMLDTLVVPSKARLTQIASQKVSFFYSREDSSVEVQVLNSLKTESPKILMTCSGGEHVFNMQNSSSKSLSFDIFDINPNQIQVFENKLNFKAQACEGKFESLFKELRSYFKGIYALDRSNINWEQVDYVIDQWFSNEALNAIFGEDATKHSSANFANHFKNAFKASMQSDHPNALNVLFGTPVSVTVPRNLQYTTKVSPLNNLQPGTKYDLIDISNIGDWMPIAEYRTVLLKMIESLNQGGALICRKLLGDYDLLKELEAASSLTRPAKIKEMQDNTHFYSETVALHVL